ncbi:MAG TPA: DUF998 domain-containing protein [Candidatus Limnocylindrales bacterium]|jgi:hypothetical membrane protein
MDDKGVRRRHGGARRAAILAIAGILVYFLVDVALRVLEPQYSLLRNAESDYGNGAFAWLMDLDFVLRGAASAAVVLALTAVVRAAGLVRLGLSLVLVWAVASALLAFFPDDLASAPVTSAGRVHLVLAVAAFVAMSVGAVIVAWALRRDAAWRPIIPLLSGLAVAGLVALPLVGRPPLRGDLGLFERLFLGLELGWLLVVAAWAHRLDAHERSRGSVPN